MLGTRSGDRGTCGLVPWPAVVSVGAEYQDLLPGFLPRAADNVEYDDENDDENDESTQNRTYVRCSSEAGGKPKDKVVADDEAAAAGTLSETEEANRDDAGGDFKDRSVTDDEAAAAGGMSEAEDGDETGGDRKDEMKPEVINDDDAGSLGGASIDQLFTEDRGKCCCQIFGVDSSSSETAVKEALIRRNEADLKRKYRHEDPAAMPSTSVTSHQSKINPPKRSPPRSKESTQRSASSSIANTKTPPGKSRATLPSALASSSSIPLSASPVSNVPSRTNSAITSTTKKTTKTPFMIRKSSTPSKTSYSNNNRSGTGTI